MEVVRGRLCVRSVRQLAHELTTYSRVAVRTDGEGVGLPSADVQKEIEAANTAAAEINQALDRLQGTEFLRRYFEE
jgi:hypothetical protein